ncbi:MAG: hypothetical protein ACLGSD_07195 [Acidobacteriota bacterium]
MKRLVSRFAVALVGSALMALAACKSPHVEVTVVNNTGSEVRLLEVDYPSASFGFDSIAAGASKHYKIQVQDSGNVKVQYNGVGDKQFQSSGPELKQGFQGTLLITLEPGGKAEFVKAGTGG